MIRQLKPALLFLGVFTILTGLIYPALITGMAQLLFPAQANGNLIEKNGQVIGSTLIGQQFDEAKYFWGRPSATSGVPYNASASGGSNYSALNPSLFDEVQTRLAALKVSDPQNTALVPVDLVTSSGSGLDPNISVASAEFQAERVTKARGISLFSVQSLIDKYTTGRMLGILGEQTVNVLELNIALDQLK
jgi:K+-transporting ATPase ATPase C chain